MVSLLFRSQKIASMAAVCFALSSELSAQIVADGTTATTVTTHTDGTTNVVIAPSISDGLSYNSYSQFDVGSDGIYLDNRIEGARTIVNEVKSTDRSYLMGPIEVLGSRSHVIVANPNGVTVDGATFINTGGAVVGAGEISLVNRTIAPGTTQLNAVLTTSKTGDVLVTGSGMTTENGSIDIYGRRVKIDGPVVNLDTSSDAAINLTAGWTEVEFDSSVLPLSSVQNWSTVTALGEETEEVLVEVTNRGSLKASRVYVGVSDRGAGVSYAGDGYATAHNFAIDASGNIGITGASIRANRNVIVRQRQVPATTVVKRKIVVKSRGDKQSKIEAVNGGLLMLAESGSIENFGALLQGSSRDPLNTLMQGGVTLSASEDIKLLTSNANQLAIAFASNDDLVVNADGDVTNTHGRFLSNKTVNISAGGLFRNEVVNTNAGLIVQSSQSWSKSKPLWYSLWLARKRTVATEQDYGSLAVPNQLAYVVGQDVNITATSVENSGGEIDANVGSVSISADNISNESIATGALSFSETCGLIICTSHGQSSVELKGGHINAAQDVSLTGRQSITDRGGQILALRDLNLDSTKITIAGTSVPTVVSRPGGLRSLWRGNYAWIYSQDFGGLWIASAGSVNVNSPVPIETSAGEITWGSTVNAPNGINQVSGPAIVSPVGAQHIGVFSSILSTLGLD